MRACECFRGTELDTKLSKEMSHGHCVMCLSPSAGRKAVVKKLQCRSVALFKADSLFYSAGVGVHILQMWWLL